MNATELYTAGRLQEAIEAQMQEVKRKPAEQGLRIFLFELLTFSGDLDRARRQIEAVKYDQMELEAAAVQYRKLLEAEQARRRLFADGIKPGFFGEPPAHLALRLQAVDLLREDKPAEAADLLAEAHAATAALKGTLNDKPFDRLRDYDARLSGVLEVMAHGKYYWVGLDQVASLSMNPPQSPRDLIWFPARLDLRDGASGEVFLPTLYPLSHEHVENAVKLGRTCDWKEPAEGLLLGQGSHVFLVGEEDVPLLDWRQLKMSFEV